MVDKSFLSQLTILYVEDDEDTRRETAEIFELFFKKVLVASNGEEALDIFKETVKNNEHLDAIVSDINMPNKTGIELLEEVREISDNLPFWFTTAHSDSPNLLQAIKHKVTNYILKPINVQDLIFQIQEYIKQIFADRQFHYDREELSNYIKSIDKVAIISKTDKEGTLTYVNDAFLEISKYEEEELLGQHHNIVRHPDMPNETIDGMWMDAKEGRIWKGKVKSKAKDGSPFYISTTMLPIYDDAEDQVIEFIRISFSITKEESEKRDFKKKVMTNIQETRKKDNVARQIIDDLKDELKKYKHMDLIHESLRREKEKSERYLNTIKNYEEKLKNIKENYTIIPNEKH